MEQEFLNFYIDNYLTVSTHEELKILLHFIYMVDETGYTEATLSDTCRDLKMTIAEIERGIFSLQAKGLAKLTSVNVDENIIVLGLNYDLRQLEDYMDMPAVNDDEVDEDDDEQESEEYKHEEYKIPEIKDDLRQDLDILFKFVNGYYESKGSKFKMDLEQAKQEYIQSLEMLKDLANQIPQGYENISQENFIIDALRKLKDFSEKHSQILKNLLG